MTFAWLAFFDAILAIAMIGAGMFGAHFRLVAPFMGFQLFALGFLLSILGLLVGLLAIFLTRKPQSRAGRNRAVLATVVCALIAVPIFVTLLGSSKYPPINDITTDTAKPPAFVKANEYQPKRGRDLSYNPRNAAIQNSADAYKDLAPLKMDGPPDEVFKKVAILAGEIPTWQITRNDPETHTLEGIATSGLFKFKDDFIIEVRPADGGGSLVEMRSKSRDGKGDLGTNYHRIVSFLSIVKAGPQTPVPGAAQVQP